MKISRLKITVFLAVIGLLPASLPAQNRATIRIYPELAKDTIPKEIYGQFAEHLGTCIYGGLWVGENSTVPNINGYRADVFNALKELNIPVLRWPGGCFADEYHWMDGIGPKDQRPKMVNNNWGGTVEDNSFGTHEFLNLCEQLGCEPYISGNAGSGTVEELAKWVEYMTSDGDSPMANLRRRNGRDRAWNVKYLGVGNESWGCGGDMRPEYYADIYRRYAVYCRNYDGNRLYKVASGASDYDYNWTEVLMKNIGRRMQGLSLHYYTVKGWNGSKGAATVFDKDDYYQTIGKCLEIEEVIKKHCDIMDRYDRDRHIGLLVDEWGTWWDEEPGTVRGHLYQQNALRDAFVASLTFDIFHRYVSRIKMANIAQIVNVLQSMILTNDRGEMLLTPTYHVFNMYKVHQDALCLPLALVCDKTGDAREIPALSATASKDRNGSIHLSISNIDADNPQTVSVDMAGLKTGKAITGTILTSARLTDHNTFE
ncbi:MAG: alpha-N-arabinofuranosidase, partial [Tannerella sp.]|nr:alpha-N-arabinofuranosidase [Tannerella sp.]